MRVATITLNVYDNYGNMLQKYALYRTLKKFADTVEVLWHPSTKPFYPYKLELEQKAEGNLRDAFFRSVREYKLKQFHDANMNTRLDIRYLEELADEYDYFVVDSDQVWNPEFNVPSRFLEFAPREKRIAYAASIVVPELPKNVQGAYRKKFLEMAHVSLREKDGCDLVEKLTGKIAPLSYPRPANARRETFFAEPAESKDWFAVMQNYYTQDDTKFCKETQSEPRRKNRTD